MAFPPPLPAFGHDGDKPSRPGGGPLHLAGAGSPALEAMARSAMAHPVLARAGGVPAGFAPDVITSAEAGDDDDWDAEADLARWIDDIDSGREQIPPEGQRAPAVMFNLGEVSDVDPGELAVMTGPDGLGGQVFAQLRPAAAMRPGPLLAALAENAADDLASLSADELLGVVAAARRLQNRAEYLELAAVAEFTRRAQAAYRASVAAGARPGRRDGEFAAADLAMELVVSERAAEDRMDFAQQLATRLPATFAALAGGVIDGAKASAIWYYTRFLPDADAAYADVELAAAAPGLRYESLARKAAKLEMKLDPEGVKARKEHARAEGRRVEARREASGNMSFGGRELSVEEGLAAKAFNDGDAIAMRRAGIGGSLRELRVQAMLDRMAGRDPLDRATSPATVIPGTVIPGSSPDTPGSPSTGGPTDAGDQTDRDGRPLPALINLLVPAGTLFGWSTTPGDAGSWGLLDADDTRTIVRAASEHPSTRWCVTVVNPDGTAAAHGCSRGPHPWIPAPLATNANGPCPPGTRTPPGTGPPPGPDQHQAAQLAALLRALNVELSPIAAGTCDHRHREDRYTPGRKVGHLVRARTASCPAPGCGASAAHSDLDHTRAYPHGPTCECNLAPPCRRHHRVKQAPGWHLEQTQPGIMVWHTPSGRAHTTTPTVYDL